MTLDTDIAIVGGGLSGTIAAIALARTGATVTLIDRNDVAPPEFRVEKLGGEQLAKLDRLGLLDVLARHSTRFDQATNIRQGRIVDRTDIRYQGIFYDDLVNAMRRALPASVKTIIGRVTDVATGPDLQRVTIADHGAIDARLVVLASGMSDVLRSRLGIEREVLHERQSLTFGFDLRPTDGISNHPAVTVYGERPRDGIDYLTLFPIGELIRANLFVFLDHRNPWIKELRTDPLPALGSKIPTLRRYLQNLELEGKVQSWIMDLAVARNVRRSGVVLIGDAYQTSCPAAGTGVSRLLTDVERLLAHVPGWLETPGMGDAKIATFYDDPQKAAMDAYALAQAKFRRSFTIDTSVPWRARRRAQFLRRRLMHGLDRLSPKLAARLRSLRASSHR
jgi:2-polyprenyl-6-methoxyphenol hydroxylase-like FAD-dependent oxidoreductase